MEVDSQMQAENILKMNTFHTTKCKAHPHERLNTSKGVNRSRELSLTIIEGMIVALGKQGVKDYERITIRKNREEIQTNI